MHTSLEIEIMKKRGIDVLLVTKLLNNKSKIILVEVEIPQVRLLVFPKLIRHLFWDCRSH